MSDEPKKRSRFEIYCEILYWGLIQIRCHSADSKRCYVEADHLHNLPALLEHFDNEELHREYWAIARGCFIESSQPEWLWRYTHLWQELAKATDEETGAAPSLD
jgi:hypothetical protein